MTARSSNNVSEWIPASTMFLQSSAETPEAPITNIFVARILGMRGKEEGKKSVQKD